MIDRYRTILSADPSSMVFVELAKALIDQGDLAEAVRVCEAGVRQHTESIVGQVLWGRALLGQGDPEAAMDHFDSAVALEPENPYAYNLIGEALLQQQLYRSALPLLRKAVSLQPGDSRVRQWLETAESAVGDARSDSLSSGPQATTVTAALPESGPEVDATVPSPFNPRAAVSPGALAQDTDPTTRGLQSATDPDATEKNPSLDPGSNLDLDAIAAGSNPFADPFDAAFGAAPAAGGDGNDATEVLTLPPPEAFEGVSSPPGVGGAPAPGEDEGESPFSDYFDAAFGRVDASTVPESEDGIIPGMTATFSHLEVEEAEAAAAPRPRAASDGLGSPVRIVPGGPSGRDPTMASMPPAMGGMPPPLPPPLPSARPDPDSGPQQEMGSDASELFGLKLPPKPGSARAEIEARKKAEAAKAEAKARAGTDDTAHALAAEYERDLRARLIPKDAPKTFFQRNSRLILVGGAVSLALITAAVATLYARSANRQESIRDGLIAAHNGIARDSYTAYLAALDALEEVLDLDGKNVEAKALSAQIEAILYAELDPDPARRKRAAKLVADPQVAAIHPDLALDARYHLLAPDARGPVGEEIIRALENRPESALLHYLAGRHRLSQRKAKEATTHFQQALKVEPGHARTVLELARYLGSLGQWKDAAGYYDNLRTNFPQHVRARIGVARTKVELGENLDGALEVLRLVEKEHGEELAPEEAVALESVFGRVLEARGQHAEAVSRFESALKAHPKRPRLAELLARSRAAHYELPQALSAVEKAIELSPRDPSLRELQAQILLDWGRYADAAAMLKSVGGKDARLMMMKARAAYHRGKLVTARKALESTRNDAGQMPAEAAIYLALVDGDAGELGRASTVLDRAAKAKKNDPLILWAQGRVSLLSDKAFLANRYFEKALARNEKAFRAAVDQAAAQRSMGKDGPAMEAVSRALAVNPYFREGRLLLGELHLASDEYEPARDIFKKVLADHPRESAAQRGLADALLGLGDAAGALGHAQEAQTRSPKDPRVLHTLGRVLLASGKEAAAVQTLLKARRLDAENAALLTDLGWAYLGQGGKGRARQAKNYFDEALTLDKRDSRARWGLGRAQLTLGDKESIGSLTAAVRGLRKESVADRAEAYRDLGRAHLEAGRKPDYRRARVAYAASLDAADDLNTRLALGRVLLEEGRGRQAIEVLEKAVALDAESAAAQLELGKARAAGGDIEGARAALDRCLVLSPKGGLAREARKALSSL